MYINKDECHNIHYGIIYTYINIKFTFLLSALMQVSNFLNINIKKYHEI